VALPRYLSVYNVAELLGREPHDLACYDTMVAAGAINVDGLIRVADCDLYAHIGATSDAPVIDFNDPSAETSLVYFVRVDNFVKIGITTGINSRLQSIQVGCPYDCILMGIRGGGAVLEDRLHAHFAADRWRGEWFKVSRSLLALIAKHTTTRLGGPYPGRRPIVATDEWPL
jgi:hypothetical protein